MKVTIKILLTAVLAALISTAAFAAPMAVETADSETEVENIEQVATSELAATYGDLTYSTSGGKVTITDCNSSATSVVIPETIGGYPVTIIGDYAFEGCTSLKSIEIPDSVTSIGDYAFSDCTSLESIEISDSVTSISHRAFEDCTSLKSIEIPDSVTSIGSYSFYHCWSLESIEIPDSVTSIGTGAFSYCTSLASVTIPDSMTSIGTAVFEACWSLESIEIPDSVTSIGNNAFQYCEGLKSIEIPDSVTSIGFSVFEECLSLESIEIPDSVTSIGSSVFRGCTSLESIEISDSVTSISNRAFAGCTSLKSIEIPDSVTSIGDYAFDGCSSLISIEIPSKVTIIGIYAFRDCESLEKAAIYSSNVVFNNSYSFVFENCNNLTLYGYSGSTTKKLASQKNIRFITFKTEFFIDLGARDDESNIRYAEIGGIQTEIVEDDDKFYIKIDKNNLLVEIVEKTAEGEFVKSQYFYIDKTLTAATKLDMDSYLITDDRKSIRTNDPMGIRFRSVITTASKNEETQFVIDEYGFIVATEDALGDTELNFDFTKYVTGVAYNRENGTDIVFDRSDDEVNIFTGYLKNIPVANYKTNPVCKTYTKITVDGKQFTLYGEAVTGNIYDTAQTLLGDTTLDTETKDALYKIILDYESAIGLPGDDLYPKE